MKSSYDLAIIGAGPAGLAAASTAAEHGLDVLVLDEQPSPGGLLYRNIVNAPPNRITLLGPDYANGKALVENFQKSGAEYSGNSIVWKVEPEGNLFFSKNGSSYQIRAKTIIIAIGAMERPAPFPGWTLPGVMGAAAIDANFKSSGTIPKGPVVLAGSGPLLLLIVMHLLDLDVEIKAVLDTTPSGSLMRSVRFLPAALKRTDQLIKGIGMLAGLKKSATPWIKGVTNYSAKGKEKVENVSYQAKSGSGNFGARVLLTHEGIIPRTDFSRQLRLPHLWNPVQRYWYPKIDQFGKTKEERVYIAGDGTFVHGGVSAAIKGRLTAVDIAAGLKAISHKEKIDTCYQLEKQLGSEHAVRPFVDEMYRPRPSLYKFADDFMICRCEGVAMKDIRNALDEGCRDVNEIKVMTRCGMGPCQSRMCGIVLAEIAADYLETGMEQMQSLAIRPPVRNITLSELAELSHIEN